MAKIACDLARASWEIEDTKHAPWVQDLRYMTLIDIQLSSAENIFMDSQGNALPPPAKGWTTTVAYVDGASGPT